MSEELDVKVAVITSVLDRQNRDITDLKTDLRAEIAGLKADQERSVAELKTNQKRSVLALLGLLATAVFDFLTKGGSN